MRTSEEMLGIPAPSADTKVAYGADANQFFELRFSKRGGKSPLVINIHGGFWRAKYSLEHAGHLCAALADAGFTTANLEYRRVGDAGGGWTGSLDDIKAAYRHLLQHVDEYNIDAERIVVIGHSAGGHLAILLAACEAISNVVSLAGVLDIEEAYRLHLSNDAVIEFMGGTPEQLPEQFLSANPIKTSVKSAAQKIIHARDDDTVPFEISQRYVERKELGGEHVELIEVPGGHYGVIDPLSAAWETVERAILVLSRIEDTNQQKQH